jgi:hypothetical protein
LTGHKLWDIIRFRKVKIYVKKRSKTNNWWAVEAVEDARPSSQPASSNVQDRRQAGEGPRLSLCGLLCPEGEI